MKEIIEKYRNRKLTVSQCHGAGVKMDKLDVVDLYLGDTPKSTRMTYDELTTNFSNVGAATVVTCLVLDKLIIDGDKPTEQPKQYKYEKADYDRLSNSIRDFEMGAKFYRELDGKYYKASNVQEVLSLYINNALLVKVEVTQEDLEAQKVEELAKLIRSMDDISIMKSVTKAKTIIEWMKQEG